MLNLRLVAVALQLRIVIVVLGWVAAAILIGVGWHDVIDAILHDGQGLLPTGFMGIMFCLTGLACGLAGNGIASVLPVRP